MAPVAVALSIIGGVVGAVQQVASARSRNAEAESNAKAMDLNAKIAQQNASTEAKNRANALAQNRRQYNLLKGEARAQSGALGIFGGSTLDVLADMDSQQLLDQTSIVDKSVNAQQSYYNQSASFKAQASGLRASKQSGVLGAIGSLVSGFGSAAQIAASSPGKPGSGT